MNRSQLEHIIRAAGDIAEDAEIVVIGSAAVFAQLPDLPETVVPSIEADVFPLNKPDRSDLIDGTIGELSPFHETFGYYAHGVSPETAGNLPKNWKQRLIRIDNSRTGGIAGLCLEIHDLVAGKYVSAREKDLRLARLLIGFRAIDRRKLLNRVKELNVPVARKMAIKARIVADFSSR